MLEQPALVDVLLARQSDAHDMYEVLCYRIAHFIPVRFGEQNEILESNETPRLIFYMVNYEMSELSGGVSRII